MADFSAIYFIRNNGGTYEAYDTAGNLEFSGTSLVTDVLNAIEAAHSIGNFAVHFGIGTFDMGAENWTLNTPNNILLSGQGPGVTIIQNNSSAASDTEPFSFTNCNYVTVSGFTIIAAGSARSTSDALDFDECEFVVVERVRITQARGRGIVMDGKDVAQQAFGCVIRDCVIDGTGATIPGAGIEMLAMLDSKIEGCTITAAGEVGVKFNRQVSSSRVCERVKLIGNTIENCTEAGVEILESRDNLVAFNTIRNNGQGAGSDDGVLIDYFGNAGLEPHRNRIIGNRIYDDQGIPTQDYGVNIPDSQSEDNVILGNTFFGNVAGPVNDVGTRTRIRGNVGIPDNTHDQFSGTITLTADQPVSIVDMDTSGGAGTVNLPDCASSAGRGFLIRRNGTSAVTVNRAGSDTIDGATSKSLDTDEAAIGIFSTGGTVWQIVDTKGTVT